MCREGGRCITKKKEREDVVMGLYVLHSLVNMLVMMMNACCTDAEWARKERKEKEKLERD